MRDASQRDRSGHERGFGLLSLATLKPLKSTQTTTDNA